VIDKKPRG